MTGSRPPSAAHAGHAGAATAGHVRALVIYARLLPAIPASIPDLRHELDDALHRLTMAASARHDIALVLTEAATNAILHAYQGRRRGPIYAKASLTPERLTLTVSDAGHGMRSHPDSPGLGVGLALIRRLARQLNITVPGTLGGTDLVATFDASGCPDTPTCEQLHPHRGSDLAREYAEALQSAGELHSETSALLAQADQAVRHAERLRRARSTPDA
jgi:anti-sigma regulatory factor (Ser/Thr protein kinase)